MIKWKKAKLWKRSIIVMFATTVLGLGSMACRLFQLQIIDGESLKKSAINQSTRETKTPAIRGSILDSNMKILAKSAPAWNVILEPANIKDEDISKISNGLSNILKLKPEQISNKIQENKDSFYVPIKRKIELDERDAIIAFLKEKSISTGVNLESTNKRHYPYGPFCAPVLGFVDMDSKGLSGLEKYYNPYLEGKSSKTIEEKTGIGTDLPLGNSRQSLTENGCDIILTIDEKIQHDVEKALEDAVEKYQTKGRGVAIVMNPKTGSILAMANSGNFDPNNYNELMDKKKKESIDKLPKGEQENALMEAIQRQWINTAVCELYNPGSVFKTITLAACLQEATVNEHSSFFCNGSVKLPDYPKPIKCTGHHGKQNYKEAFCNSCNPAFISLGFSLGIENFFNYFSAFGLTQKTNIDFPGETSGFFKPRAQMNNVDLAISAFGQSFTISPLQMITAYAAAVNGGYLVQPHLVDRIVDKDGNIIKNFSDTTVKRQVISNEISQKINSALENNVVNHEGGLKIADLAGYRVAGKTGTSEKIQKANQNGGDMFVVASFLGGVPANDPEVIALFILDEPTKNPDGGGLYGSYLAVPVFNQAMKSILPYLNIEKTG